MADEKTIPANDQDKKAEARKRQLANLKPCQKGEVRNPTGVNGHRKRQELIAAILDEPDHEPDAIDPGATRIRNVVLAMAKTAKAGDSGAGKTLVEQYAGKARQQLDLSSEDGSMSPLGPDSVAEALRAAIEAKRTAASTDVETAK